MVQNSNPCIHCGEPLKIGEQCLNSRCQLGWRNRWIVELESRLRVKEGEVGELRLQVARLQGKANKQDVNETRN